MEIKIIKTPKEKVKNTNKKTQNGQISVFKLRQKKQQTNWSKKRIRKLSEKKIALDSIIELALTLVTQENINLLQEKSKSNEDRKEEMRQKYIALNGQISKDEFTGFMMTRDYIKFLNNESSLINR